MPDDDRRLSEALAALPREAASAGFTAGVLRRIAERERAPRRLPRLALAGALVALLAVGGLVARDAVERFERRRAAAEIAALRAEHEALTAELVAMRRRAAASRPMVYLGGDEDLGFVLDVASFAQAVPAASSAFHRASLAADRADGVRPVDRPIY